MPPNLEEKQTQHNANTVTPRTNGYRTFFPRAKTKRTAEAVLFVYPGVPKGIRTPVLTVKG